MKKIILLLAISITTGTYLQAQTVTERNTKELTQEINKNIDRIDQAIQKTDWKAVQKAVDQTAVSIEKNSDRLKELIENVDFDKLMKSMGKAIDAFTENVDTKELRKSVEEVGVKVDEVFTQPKTGGTR